MRMARAPRSPDAGPPRRRVPDWMRSPPAHWWLIGFCGVVVLVVLTLQGIATHTVGPTAEPPAEPGAAAPLAHARPVLMAQGGRLVSHQPPPGRRIALTFDDGPDPRWTPRIADVLRRAGVPATFFVIGSQAARHPGIIRRLVRDGHELGDHTFTHTALTRGSEQQRRLQLELTEGVLAGITGHYARFVRPPYSATPDAVSPAQEHALARLAGRRYLIALTDFDSEDWQRRGVQHALRRATPPGSTGGVIMFHDGGGDRSQTVEAVRTLIPRLRARGFRFVGLSELAGLSRATTAPAAGAWERRRGAVFEGSVRMAFGLLDLFSFVLLIMGVLVAARAVTLLALATHHKRRTRRRPPVIHTPPVVVVVPAYNEAVGIEQAVRSLAASDYPDLDIVVVDDGSRDETASIVEGLALPGVRLVRQDNAGKAAALNTGVACSEADVIVMVDGDTLFEPGTIRRLVAPLADPAVGAVSGNTKVGNRSGLLGRWQHIE